MADELIVVEKVSVHAVFTQADKLAPILAQITEKARSIVPDTSTAKGRAEIKSLAYQVARTKTYLDGLGKDLVGEMKKLPALVDASRKEARDYLDVLADEVRQPLIEWEAEQERLAAEEKARQEAATMAMRVEADHELAVLMNREFDRAKTDRIAVETELQRRNAERLAFEAKAAAEAAVAAEIADAKRRETEAKEAAELAEQARKDAIANAEKERQAAAQREALARQQATEQERRRVEAEAQCLADKQAKREADITHRATINRAALADLIAAGLNEEQAKRIIGAIAKGLIAHVNINY